MTTCPPAEQLLEFAAGRLSSASQVVVEDHIDGCSTCRASLSALAKNDVPSHQSFGRYRLETVLGSGGMGIVYRAWDPQLARPVAIKVVRQVGASAELRTRLVREAQSLARLSHPNVCHCYDVGTEGDEVWVAMELIDGVTLRAWAIDKPQAALLEILLGAAEGIAAAHASGLVHRDIKPENVLVTKGARPVVTDFGLARADITRPIDPSGSTISGDPLLTATGAIVGTPAYLAPEQLTGELLDARVDQFAWAVMAWELLTGTRPFPVIAAIRLDAIRAGITAPSSLPKQIAAALMRAMALAPRDRFASMRELIDAIRARPIDEPVSKTPFIVGGAVLLAIAGTVAVWQLTRKDAPAVAPPVVKVEPDATPADAPLADAAVAMIAPDAAPAVAPVPKKPPPVRGGSATATPTSQPPLRPLNNPKFLVSNLYAVTVLECRVPIDVKNPDPALAGFGVVDWGTVTRKETVIAKLGEREFYMPLLEVRGARATYRFDADFDVMGVVDVEVGTPMAVCPDAMRPEKFQLYKVPANWSGGLDILRAALPLSGTPAVAALKSLSPLHVDDLQLQISGTKGKLTLKPASHYLVWTKPTALDGARWKMKDWWLEVGNVKGADLIAAGKRAWVVIETPVFEPGPSGEKPKLVAKAVLVLPEILPH